MLTIALLLSLSIPAMATEVTAADASDLRSIAYMNLDTADEQTRTNILAARNEIMFSTSWVADDVNGWVLDENGVVIETLPHFSEVFPSDWDDNSIAMLCECRTSDSAFSSGSIQILISEIIESPVNQTETSQNVICSGNWTFDIELPEAQQAIELLTSTERCAAKRCFRRWYFDVSVKVTSFRRTCRMLSSQICRCPR